METLDLILSHPDKLKAARDEFAALPRFDGKYLAVELVDILLSESPEALRALALRALGELRDLVPEVQKLTVEIPLPAHEVRTLLEEYLLAASTVGYKCRERLTCMARGTPRTEWCDHCTGKSEEIRYGRGELGILCRRTKKTPCVVRDVEPCTVCAPVVERRKKLYSRFDSRLRTLITDYRKTQNILADPQYDYAGALDRAVALHNSSKSAAIKEFCGDILNAISCSLYLPVKLRDTASQYLGARAMMQTVNNVLAPSTTPEIFV